MCNRKYLHPNSVSVKVSSQKSRVEKLPRHLKCFLGLATRFGKTLDWIVKGEDRLGVAPTDRTLSEFRQARAITASFRK